jgi:hypothetical protein
VEQLAIIREFKTAQFRVIVDAIVEDCPDISWDETGEIADKLENGDLVIFCARARVIHDQLGEIASDYLGNCINTDFDDFMDHKECAAYTRKLRAEGSTAICGGYFADMIAIVIRGAREAITDVKSVYIRGA